MRDRYLPQFDVESDAFDRLPRVCLARRPSDNRPIRLHRGAKDYYEVHPDTDVDRFNEERGITLAQIEAMQIGSMFGWGVPGADPAHYQEERGGLRINVDI